MQVQYSQPVTQTTVGSRLASGAVVENVEYRVVSGPRAGTVLPPSEASVTRNYVTTATSGTYVPEASVTRNYVTTTATSGTYVPETTTSYVTQTATSPYTNSETKYPTDAVQPGAHAHANSAYMCTCQMLLTPPVPIPVFRGTHVNRPCAHAPIWVQGHWAQISGLKLHLGTDAGAGGMQTLR